MTSPSSVVSLETLEHEATQALPCDWDTMLQGIGTRRASQPCQAVATMILLFPQRCASGEPMRVSGVFLLCLPHLKDALVILNQAGRRCAACGIEMTGNAGHVSWWGPIAVSHGG